MGRSIKTNFQHEIIKSDKEEAYLEANIQDNSIPHQICMKINKKGKKITWNSKPIEKTTELLKGLSTVYVSPDDDLIFSGPPSERRTFLDVILSKLSSEYLHRLGLLKHTVKLLNHHYKHANALDYTLINLYHEKIAHESTWIVKERKRILSILELKMNQYLLKITNKTIQFLYLSTEETLNETEAYKKEYRYRESCFGAHRDDVVITYNHQDVRRGISLGERRLMGILLRWSEKEIQKELLDREPILLLDDALLGIDDPTQYKLIELIASNIQSVMTVIQKPLTLFKDIPVFTAFIK